jgi:hypothetical protein
VRPAIATVIGPGWEPRLVEHTRATGLARLVGRCCDHAGLVDVTSRADVVFIGSEAHWLPASDLRQLAAVTRLIGVATDAPGARLLDRAGVRDVIDADTPPAGMLAMALAEHRRQPGKIVEVTGPRGAPGRSEVALALTYAMGESERSCLIEADHAGPSLGLRMLLPPSRSGAMHRAHGASLMPAPTGTSVVGTVRVAGFIDAAREAHDTTVIDGGPYSAWHSIIDVDQIVIVGEASDVGVVRLARLCDTWSGPTPRLVINRHRPGQDLRQVRRATGLEPAAVISEHEVARPGLIPTAEMRSALRGLALQRTAL